MSNELKKWYDSVESGRSDEVKLDFALQLSVAIEELGLTRQQYAELVGVSGARITKALRGDTNLTIESMDKLASAVGRDIHVHLARKGSKVRFFDVLPSKGNSFQTFNHKGSYVTARNTYSRTGADHDEELLAL